MKAEDQPKALVSNRRAWSGALRLVLAAGICSVGLHVAPGHAVEPLACNFGAIPVVSIHDARELPHGTSCTVGITNIYSPGSLTNAGLLTNSDSLTNHEGGILANATGGLLTNDGQMINDGSLENFGLLNNFADTLNNGVLDNHASLINLARITNENGTFNNLDSVSSTGTITNLGGTLANTGTLSSSGRLENLDGGRLINQGTLDSTGTWVNSSASLDNIGDLRNSSTLTNLLGRITNFGDLDNFGRLTNQLGGTVVNQGWLSNAGKLRNEWGATLTNYRSLSNTGTLENEAGATFVNLGELENQLGMLNSGTLTNSLIGTLTNNGQFRNLATAHFDNAGTFRNDLEFVNAGTLVSTGRIEGSGFFTQTGGSTTLQGGISQTQIIINGGTFGGAGHITTIVPLRLGPDAVLAPGEAPGDIGAFVIDAPVARLLGSLDLDIDSLASFDSLVADGGVDFDASGSTWFNFYLGNDTSQGEGDSFDFFSASSFSHFDAMNFRCFGLMAGLGCELSMINGGHGLQLALNGTSGGSGGGAVGVPEPDTLGIMCLGLALLGGSLGLRRWRNGAARDAS